MEDSRTRHPFFEDYKDTILPRGRHILMKYSYLCCEV